jgi:hypothetical protein
VDNKKISILVEKILGAIQKIRDFMWRGGGGVATCNSASPIHMGEVGDEKYFLSVA